MLQIMCVHIQYMRLYMCLSVCCRLHVDVCRTVRKIMNKVEIVVFQCVYIWTHKREREANESWSKDPCACEREGESL